MTLYRYTATDTMARTIHGNLDAANEHLAADELRRSGYFPIAIQPHTAPNPVAAQATATLFQRGPTRGDVLQFTQQLHNLLGAGLEVDRSLAILAELSDRRAMRMITLQVLADIRSGGSLADSLARHPLTFPKLYVQMVKAGEAGGMVEMVLGRLATFLERAEAIREEVSSALIYPALVLLAGAGAVLVLLNVVLPRFAGMFSDNGELLPMPTQIVLALSAFTTDYWWAMAGALVALLLAGQAALQTDAGRLGWDRAKLRVPVLGPLLLELEVARFARMLGTLLQSGVPILMALGIVSELVSNAAIARSLPAVHEGVKRGEGLAGPLKSTDVFPPLAVQMASVGEEAGRLEEMLLKVAEVYDQHVKTSVKKLLSLVEPTLILVLGVVVGFIVVAMLLAVFSLSDLAQ
jgi:general secretion pathway protein F